MGQSDALLNIQPEVHKTMSACLRRHTTLLIAIVRDSA